MKIEDIQPQKKYWKTQTTGGGRAVTITAIAIRVLEVDLEKKKVLASLNEAPAQWVASRNFCKWQVDKPKEMTIKASDPIKTNEL